MRNHIQEQALHLLRDMSLQEKIAQLIVIRAQGNYYSEDADEFLHLSRMVNEYQVGGIIFFRGEIYNQAVLHNKLQRLSRIPLWISQDMEFGAAMRISGTTRFTPAMGIAATGNPHNAFEKGRITALEARAIGVHQIYAPVVDINNNPENPVINVRSFSEDPETVSMYAESFIKGVQSQGIVATAKHFPGHGDTDVDSHIGLPVVQHTRERLNQLELLPFRRVIDAGVGSVMSAHIAFPNITEGINRPATLEPGLMHGLLRDELGFDGLIVTDGLEMQGIASNYAPGEAAVLALNAGADVLLLSPDELTAIFQIKEAVQRGEISESRIDDSVLRILALKIDHGLMRNAEVNINRISRVVNTRANQLTADRIARESITVLRNNRDILPIRPDRFPKITVIAIAGGRTGNVGSEFRSELSKYHPDISFHLYDERTSEQELNEAIASARQANLIIVGSFLPLTTGRPITFNREQQRFVRRIQQLGRPKVVISFSSPYVVNEIPDADVHILSWTSLGSHSAATAAALFGASDVSGRLPISIPGLYVRGEGIEIPKTILRQDRPEAAGLSTEKLYEITRIMNRAVQDSVFPGGTVAVVRNGILAWNEGYGYHDYNKRRPVRSTDIYDIASLTKPVATTTAVMMLAEQGRLRLDQTVQSFIPGFRSGMKGDITIEHLLNHTSGLPAYRLYVDQFQSREAILQAVISEPLLQPPGEGVIYSDLGFILLAEIVEQITEMPLDRFLNTQFFYPIGMTDTLFNPRRRGRWTLNRIPPTEVDRQWRNTIIRGDVHDERAHFMGGIAGHAGLFSTSGNLAIYGQFLLNNGSYGGREYVSDAIMRTFTSREASRGGRALGFDLKSLNGFTTAGQLSSNDTFGHLGFTGTSLWVDPQRNLAVIILTNRTYPERGTSAGINQVRARVMDAVIEAITDVTD
ncbi:MAG: serine hydrolase [Candidatus Cyclonatronum sp.]|uniref:glycoside hydrolase family 3 N-terminal domain-containing protein n=1 Tax=Cyclonatronum sp. TaxID=3024185 RepID=UPI0025C60CE7|nr:glycoside hydrolase family 3 N-terminal domain-containing protein [Cyclonatronum sp.]MCH8486120.1 serine hydrolase [Cyclonatronum sp.]